MKRQSLVIMLAIFIIILLSIWQVVVSNRLSTAGILVGKIEDEISFYEKENALLAEELFLASSLQSLASRAASLGFVENKSQFVLKTSLPFALRP